VVISPEDIINIINGLSSFKYEEKGNEETNCAICIDKLKTG